MLGFVLNKIKNQLISKSFKCEEKWEEQRGDHTVTKQQFAPILIAIQHELIDSRGISSSAKLCNVWKFVFETLV